MGKVDNRDIFEIKPWLNDDKQNVDRLNAIVNGGSDITVEAVSFTENGTFTAPSGKAYSPVTVNVAGSSSDFSTATVTIIISGTTEYGLPLNNCLTRNGRIETLESVNDASYSECTVVLYQDQPVFLDDEDEVVVSVSGNIVATDGGYNITGDCSITVKQYGIL